MVPCFRHLRQVAKRRGPFAILSLPRTWFLLGSAWFQAFLYWFLHGSVHSMFSTFETTGQTAWTFPNLEPSADLVLAWFSMVPCVAANPHRNCKIARAHLCGGFTPLPPHILSYEASGSSHDAVACPGSYVQTGALVFTSLPQGTSSAHIRMLLSSMAFARTPAMMRACSRRISRTCFCMRPRSLGPGLFSRSTP